MKIMTALTSAALFATAFPALADMTMVSCPGYVVSMSDEIAIQAEALAGSTREFERIVCERSTAAEDMSGDPQIVPVYIEELDVTTRMAIFPIGDDS